MWREFVLPSFSEVCAQLKKYCPEVFIYCHICGNVFPVVEDLAGSGLDCIGPMDPLGGHSAAQYRNKVGEGFCLMGGVDTMTLLKKTEQQVYDESMLCIKQAGKNGAYVLGSGCAVPRDTPSGNIKAMVKASKDYQSM
jgi:uroporphyrinogen-III decarboxylase